MQFARQRATFSHSLTALTLSLESRVRVRIRFMIFSRETIFKVFQHFRNQTKLQRMDLIIKQRRLRWLGHVLRMEDDRIPKQAMRWQMDSCTRRRPGRPRLDWIDTVTRDLKSIGMAWEEAEQAAVDREDWRGRVAELRSGQDSNIT